MKSLEARRKRAGYSQEFIARHLGVSRGTVDNWEKGRTEPDASQIKALAALLDTSADELLADE